MKKALFLPCKNPQKDLVKTRLRKIIGEKKSVEIYSACLDGLIKEHIARNYDIYIVLSNNTDDKYFKERYSKIPIINSFGNSLSDVLFYGFKKLLKKYDMVITMSSDSVVKSCFVNEAFQYLTRYSSVISPSLDGGYTLLGMKKFIDVFTKVKMSQKTVFEETKKILSEKGSVKIMSEQPDLDVIEDIPYIYSKIYSEPSFISLKSILEPLNKKVGISIVCATYNRPKDTKELLESIKESINNFRKSNFPNDLDIEIIMACPKKDRETLEMLYDLNEVLLKVIEVELKGLAYSRDVAFRKAKNEYIISVDSDCIVFDDWIKSIYLSIKKHKFPDAIQGAYFYSYYKNWITNSECNWDKIRFFKQKQVDTRNFIIKKKIYEKIGGFETKYFYSAGAEDLIMKDRLNNIGTEIIFDESIKVRHKYPKDLRGELRRYAYYGRGAIHVKRHFPELFKKEFSPQALWRNLLTFRFGFIGLREFLYQFIKLVVFTKNYFDGVRIYKRENMQINYIS